MITFLAAIGGIFAVVVIALIVLYALLQRPTKNGGSPFE